MSRRTCFLERTWVGTSRDVSRTRSGPLACARPMRAPRRVRAEQKGGGALLSGGAAEGSPHRRGAPRHRLGERETDGGYDVVRRRAARVDGDTEAGGDQIGRDGELVGR